MLASPTQTSQGHPSQTLGMPIPIHPPKTWILQGVPKDPNIWDYSADSHGPTLLNIDGSSDVWANSRGRFGAFAKPKFCPPYPRLGCSVTPKGKTYTFLVLMAIHVTGAEKPTNVNKHATEQPSRGWPGYSSIAG